MAAARRTDPSSPSPFVREGWGGEGREERRLVFSSRFRHVTVVCRRVCAHILSAPASRRNRGLRSARDRPKKSLHFRGRLRARARPQTRDGSVSFGIPACLSRLTLCLENVDSFVTNIRTARSSPSPLRFFSSLFLLLLPPPFNLIRTFLAPLLSATERNYFVFRGFELIWMGKKKKRRFLIFYFYSS